jgi:hypothetical protein
MDYSTDLETNNQLHAPQAGGGHILASVPLPAGLEGFSDRPPPLPLPWLASGVTEAAMPSGMVAMKKALAIGLRD